MTVKRLMFLCSFLLVPTVGCNNDTPSSPNYENSGGSSGGGSNARGGAVGTGGSQSGNGGSTGSGAGGTESASGGSGGTKTVAGGSGGHAGAGGVLSTGGVPSGGGTTAMGGNAGTGGVTSAGGTTATGAGGTGGRSTSSDAGADAVAGVSYSTQIAPLLRSNCALSGCHSGSRPQSGIDLSSYSSAKTNASLANTAIQTGRMPPFPASPLSAADKQLFQAWVTAGAPNN